MNKNTSNNFVNKINNKKRISIKTKIALWYTSMIIIIVLCFLGTMVYKRLKTTVEKINQNIEFEDGELMIDNNLSVITNDIFISIYDKNYDFIYGNTNIDLEVSKNSAESNKLKIIKQENSNSK